MKTIIAKADDRESICHAAEIIRKGGIVAFPTETVYGLGANAFNPLAVARVFEVKKRPFFDPLIVHICAKKQIEKLCSHINSKAERLIERFFPGPLTLVLPKKSIIPDIVTAGLETVAVRMPANEAALKLIEESGCPIAAPSANPFGYLSPTCAEDVLKQLEGLVDMVLDGGSTVVGIESTVVYFEGTKPVILRHGGITLEELREEIGEVEVLRETPSRPMSPGLLKRHYSPRTPIKIVRDFEKIEIEENRRVGILAFCRPVELKGQHVIEVLSKSGDLREAAVNFFSALHRLDASNVEVIYAEALPEKGLGRAIMERLKKAAG